jgi:hypothetical protein
VDEIYGVKRVLRNEKRTMLRGGGSGIKQQAVPTTRVRSSDSRGETVSSGSTGGKEGGSVRYTMKTGPNDDVYL